MFDSQERELKELREADIASLTAEEKDEAVVAWARLRNQVDALDASLLAAWRPTTPAASVVTASGAGLRCEI